MNENIKQANQKARKLNKYEQSYFIDQWKDRIGKYREIVQRDCYGCQLNNNFPWLKNPT
jgi:hypothetical protein